MHRRCRGRDRSSPMPRIRRALAPLAAERGLRLLRDRRAARRRRVCPAARSAPSARALILYTSGTTSKPKGVVTTHAILAAQIRRWSPRGSGRADDHILHVLPLHHLHGILNLLCCALWSGATLRAAAAASTPTRSGTRIAAGDGLTLFMAVPTIYARLRTAWEAAPPERRAAHERRLRRLRLMVSGSAALPVALLDAWRAISGHTLLERYGMTEIGMGTRQPAARRAPAGHVGVPFPGVEVRLVDEAGAVIADGDRRARSRCAARRVPRVLAAARGDAPPRSPPTAGSAPATSPCASDGSLPHPRPRVGRHHQDRRLQGVGARDRGGAARRIPPIAECAVVGVADDEWGQRVAAAVVLRPGADARHSRRCAPGRKERLRAVQGADAAARRRRPAAQRDGQSGQARRRRGVRPPCQTRTNASDPTTRCERDSVVPNPRRSQLVGWYTLDRGRQGHLRHRAAALGVDAAGAHDRRAFADLRAGRSRIC